MSKLLVTALKRHLAGGKPIVPEAGALFWNLFMQISASRTYHGAGPNPISHAEIEAFCRLHRWPLQPHHITIIRALDNAWLEHAYRQMEARRDGKSEKDANTFDGRRAANAPALTAQAFDLVFG